MDMSADWKSIILGGVLLVMTASGCAGNLYDWEASTRATAAVSASVLWHQQVAVLPAYMALPHSGFRQLVTTSLDLALAKVFPEATVLASKDVSSIINMQGLVEPYGELVAAYANHGILERTRLDRVGTALGVRYVFLPTLIGHYEDMPDRWVLFGLRIFQTRVGVVRLALQLWDTKTGTVTWASNGEVTVSSDVYRQARVQLDHAVDVLWTAMLLDLRTGRTKSTYTPLDKLFQRFGPDLTKEIETVTTEVESTEGAGKP